MRKWKAPNSVTLIKWMHCYANEGFDLNNWFWNCLLGLSNLKSFCLLASCDLFKMYDDISAQFYWNSIFFLLIRVIVVKINSVKVHFKTIINEKFYLSFHAFSVKQSILRLVKWMIQLQYWIIQLLKFYLACDQKIEKINNFDFVCMYVTHMRGNK